MSKFVRRWESLHLDGTANTDKSTSVSSVSDIPSRLDRVESRTAAYGMSFQSSTFHKNEKRSEIEPSTANTQEKSTDKTARSHEDEITWRVRYMLASDPPTFWLLNLPPKPGQCWSCEEPQPFGQDGKCTRCCLAAVRVSRIVDGLDAPPEDESVPVVDRVRLPSWDCSCGGNAVGELLVCLFCGAPKPVESERILA